VTTSSKLFVLLLPIEHTILFLFLLIVQLDIWVLAFLRQAQQVLALSRELRIPLRAVPPA
jgi:hypothetical protein